MLSGSRTACPARVLLPWLLLLPAVGGPLGSPGRAEADDLPKPSFERVDHADPQAQLAPTTQAGAGKRALSIAEQLKAKTPAETLGRIARWLSRNVRVDEGLAGRFRPVEEILADGKLGGDADEAYLFGVLARAAGIPTTWVKSVPAAWIAAYQAGGESLETRIGKVFLEVHVDGAWRLLDPATARLYDNYDPRARLLPGELFAYDKGGDPYALVLPNRRDAWKQQARAYFSALDLAHVPWASSRDLLARWRVHVVGRGGAASYARAASRTLGYSVQESIDSHFARGLAQARGSTIIVCCHNGRPMLPEEHWSSWLPPGHREVIEGKRALERGWMDHELSDGTRVILILAQEFGPVEVAVSEALEG